MIQQLDAIIGYTNEHIYPHTLKTVFMQNAAVDETVDSLAEQSGLGASELKFVLSLILVYALAPIYRLVPGTTLRHIFNLVVGIWLTQFCLNEEWVHILISGLVTYLLLVVMPGRLRAVSVFLWAILYMSACHIFMMRTNYLFGRMDFTGVQMVVTIKLSMMGYNLYDGTAGFKEIQRKIQENSENKRAQAKYNRRLKFAIYHLPNPLEFFSYIFCFATVIVGPAFEFETYKEAVSGAYEHKDNASGKTTAIQLTRASGPWLPALKKLLLGLFCIVVYVLFQPKVPIFALSEQSFYDWNVLKDTVLPFLDQGTLPVSGALLGGLAAVQEAGFGSFLESFFNVLGKTVFVYLSLLIIRHKFYFAWKLSEGSANLCNFGYDRETESWDGAKTMDILGFELPTNFTSAVKSWNVRTQIWLTHYVHLRPFGSTLTTFVVSALWHGFYPGYYLFFVSFAVATFAERAMKTMFKSTLAHLSLLCSLTTIFYANYFAASFQLYEMRGTMLFWGDVYKFVPHLLLLVPITLQMVMPGKKKKE
jgi:hypothetical protein